ncbi:MAG: hypothetical protein A2725_04145 [Candidatus Magasanikbacteria bacterium RIFCSPHIGHO2_01_FULL_33_34]|uniref:CopG family transcriptional regulator n=1 Tax=Candidatus Magasanikbacteria bacterium RIFCSPHIGHO2_01_FULL_33_34 TaxID=1798671 RepID=A0A1F6LHV4_9BACT|nr:MAG: hypothetical protein A2725_04145 [Candidatus Magasanikbacteria bacterium RIFCSPHIGHO2_01_FULL_33_34]OGH65157.1 MAG: hypothetical protein A3B83_03905 [Candidatus Magasanikbacteria bacterium RIFCSPHIGHO2_02_FULL_33_17]OGH75299.1 MAG: hypothetical protein A3A89_04260 [Candidatus Magasanikbacteria bacterium RIFCSPLOWO2_01_FULL_33_34]OGH81723.1 MAG: hypothetical protein A3F93_03180 [Candidatus Magasanikbacteria bacterium RIFCSPLOWO2_12_FULL_34_7]
MKNKKLIYGFVAIVILVGGLVIKSNIKSNVDLTDSDQLKDKLVLYRSPNCGCCVNYAAYLKKEGYEVEIISTDDMNTVKEEKRVPFNMSSCHTVVMGDYVIEGHIPVEGIKKLASERPNIVGITLPDMPQGSPGMPGRKVGLFDIYSIENDGNTSLFTQL